MTRTIQVTGARGGQGTSTIAASLAVLAAGHGPTLLCSDEPAITAALLGVAMPLSDDEVVEVAPNLDLATAAGGSVTPPRVQHNRDRCRPHPRRSLRAGSR